MPIEKDAKIFDILVGVISFLGFVFVTISIKIWSMLNKKDEKAEERLNKHDIILSRLETLEKIKKKGKTK